MFDAVKKAEDTISIVCRDNRRKYYRFRSARFYGGIATADCVGCNLRCCFCWSWKKVINPQAAGSFYSPQEIAAKLIKTACKKNFQRLRISGNEPTLARDHLLRVLENIPPQFQFILETNGILIGFDPTYARDLAAFDNLHVRVSLKGTNENEFSQLTGATPGGFQLQINALENLIKEDVSCHAAAMIHFSSTENITALINRLGTIAPSLQHFEPEEVSFYGDVEKRIQSIKL